MGARAHLEPRWRMTGSGFEVLEAYADVVCRPNPLMLILFERTRERQGVSRCTGSRLGGFQVFWKKKALLAKVGRFCSMILIRGASATRDFHHNITFLLI